MLRSHLLPLLIPTAFIIATASSSSHCGYNYNDAIQNCNRPCTNIGIDAANCDEGQYCFGPNLNCVANADDEAGDGNDATEANNATTANNATSTASDNEGMNATTTENNSTEVINNSTTTTSEDEGDAMMQYTVLSAQSINFQATDDDDNNNNETDTAMPTASPTIVPTASPIVSTSSPTNSPSSSTNVPTSSPTTEGIKLANERRGIDNPGNHYCGTQWDQAKLECNTSPNAIPCPAGLPCLTGQLCFAMGSMCTPVTFTPTSTPSSSPTTNEPTTSQPTSSPIDAANIANMYFCGTNEEDANTNCGTWCRYGSDTECPDGQSCYSTTNCNATSMNYTSYPTSASPTSSSPTISPSTPVPTEDLNPNNYYCANEWRDATYDGECGIPCPSGQFTDCPSGMYCYGNQDNCIKTHKVGVSTSWCGSTFEDMADTCHQECPNGTDDECPDGETCWGDSPCALLDSKIEMDAEKASKLWCGSSYKHLVEHCPKRCEGGTNDECGKDDDGNDMICFDMSTEDTVCNTTGVGIRDPVDPDNLWCGSSWNHVLENCPKKCPMGTDEECDSGHVCYDLTGNEPMICKTEGYGVKAKADPNKRFCGNGYNDMMEFCPKRCPNGDECTGGMTCYEESPCELEGQSAPGFVKQDSSKMFCGSSYGDATSCGNPCPSGSNADCPAGKTCWAQVECGFIQPQSQTIMANKMDEAEAEDDESSNLMVEVTVEIEGGTDNDEEADNESEPGPVPAEEQPQPAPAADEPEPQSAPAPEESQPAEPVVEEPKQESNPPPPAPKQDTPPAPEPKQESNPPPASKAESNPPPAPKAESNPPPAPKAESNPPPAEESSNPPPAEESSNPPPPAESSNPPPAESSANPPPAAESSNPPPSPPAAASQPATDSEPEGNPFGDVDSSTTSDVAPLTAGVSVDNLRIALYGLSDLSAAQLVAWEDLTASYVNGFYNDASNTGDFVRDSVSDVSTQFDVTSLNLSSGRRLLRAQIRRRREQDDSAYLLTYTQTAQYYTEEDISLEQVLLHPFQSGAKRADYLAYLKEAEPELFGDVTSISAVFLPNPFEVANADTNNADGAATSTSGGSSPTPVSSPSGGGVYSTNFYCHNSGEACPQGTCPNNDLCMFVPDSSDTPIAPFSGGAPTDSAANLVNSVLDGSFAQAVPAAKIDNPPPSPPTPAIVVSNPPPSPPTPAVMTNPQPSPPTRPTVSIPRPSPPTASMSNPQPQTTPDVNNPESPTQITVTVTTSNANDNQVPLSSATYGPTTVPSLQMTLVGISIRSAKQVFEWQYLTAIYEQKFYNDSPLSRDYIQNNVYAFATELEVVDISYDNGLSSSVTRSAIPSTTLTFKQTSKYNSVDPNIGMVSIVLQPFSKPQYRDDYVKYLQTSLGETFGALQAVPSVAQTGTSDPIIALVETFFCATRWPVDCGSAQKCENDSDCPLNQDCLIEPRCVAPSALSKQPEPIQQQSAPMQETTPVVQLQSPPVQQNRPAQQSSPVQQNYPAQQSPSPQQTSAQANNASPYYNACNLCKPNQIGLNNPINFNGRLTDCSEAYNFMAKHYNEGESNCVEAQKVLSGTCCRDQGGTMQSQSAPLNSSPVDTATSSGEQPVPASSPSNPSTSDDGASSPTKITVTVNLNDVELAGDSDPVEMLYPSNTYYCGTSLETAASSCSIPCPSSRDNECPGDLQCFGGTECMNRGSFYCGESWLDASDKCSKPCPTGDALECEAGEACFAWTSCENTESFYCGVSFEDASSNCDLPCPSRSSLDCPDGQGCFAYTTCEETQPGPHEVSPQHVPMNDYFCGDSKELAASTCSIACQGGEDSECPGEMKCYEGTGCSSRDSFWCGSDWMTAAETCSQPCSSGSSEDCPSGESCFAHTNCQHTANLFWCGDTHEEAGESCSTPCESRSSEQCPGDQVCFAFVTACAASQPESQSYSFGIANTQWDFESAQEDAGSNNVGAKEGAPDWYTKWETDLGSSSSTRLTHFIVTSIICLSLVLSTAL